MIWNIIEFAATAAEAFLISNFITKYNGYKYPEKRTVIFGSIALALFIATVTLNSISTFEGFSGIIYIIILFIGSITVLNGRISEKLFSSVIAIALVVLINITVLTTFSFLLNKNISELAVSKSVYRIIILFITKFLYFLITYFILCLKNRMSVNLQKIEWFMVILIFVTSLIVSLFIFETAYRVNLTRFDYCFLISSICGLIILNVVTFYLFTTLNQRHNEQLQMSMLKVQVEQQSKSFNELKELSLEMKKLRHDMKKYLDITSELIAQGKNEKAVAYIKDVKNEKFKASFSMIGTSSDVVNAVLNSKIAVCKKNNITVDYLITGDFRNFSELDLSVLLGNLLDNAIEAATVCRNPGIKITICENKAYLIFIITNSVSSSVLKGNPEFKTTKQDKKYHGLGLLTVKEVTEKYNGMINFSEDDMNFTVDVRLKKVKLAQTSCQN